MAPGHDGPPNELANGAIPAETEAQVAALVRETMQRFGFRAARPLLARVWLGVDEPQPLTHTLALVTIGAEEWIADSGFGGSDAPPMRLREGEEATSPDGARYRLDRDGTHGWMLSRNGAPGSTDGRGGVYGDAVARNKKN